MDFRTRAKSRVMVWLLIAGIGAALGSVGDEAWAQAFWTFNGEPVCTWLFEQRIPTAVSDGLGGAIITWQTNHTGEWDLFAQRMNCEGDRLWQPWDPRGIAVCCGLGDAMNPRMVSDNAGGAIVAWEDYRDQAVTGVDIWAQRLDQDGNLPWNPGGIPTGKRVCVEEDDQIYPAMATDMAEGAIIAWSHRRASSRDWDIWAQRIALDNGMRLWPPEGKPICTAPGDQYVPAIVADATGGAIIAWCDFRSGSEFDGDIYAQRVDVNGNPLWPLDGVWIGQLKFWYENFNFAGPKIISDDVGGAIVVWMGPAPETWNGVYAQRINPGGIPQWDDGGVRVDPPGIESRDKRWPAVTTDHMSGAVVAWTNVLGSPGGGDIIRSEIWAERVKSDGTLLWGGVPVRTPDHPDWQSNVYPGIASDGEGGAIVTWKDDRRKLEWWPRHYYDLYAQWLDDGGNCIWQSKGVPVDTGYYRTESQFDIFHYWSEHIVTDEANGAVITWASDKADPYRPVWDIYAQRVSGKLIFGSTQYPNGRKLCRIPGTDDLWVAYEYSGRVYAGLSADAGKRWQTWYLGDLSDDGFPTIAVAPPSEQAAMPLPFPVVVWAQPGSGSDPPALRCARFCVESDAWQIGSLYYQSSHTPYLPSIVIDDGRIAHLTWEMVTGSQRQLHYGTFQTDDPEVWPPVFFHDPPLDNEPGLDWFMAPCIALNEVQDPLEPNIVYKKGDWIYYKVKEDGVWSDAQLISQTDRTASFPFLEIYGDSIQALWHAYKPPSDDDEVWYRSKAVYDLYWRNDPAPLSETPFFESQFPCMAADYASWSEEWDSPGDNWEIVMREKPFDESFDNISQTGGALSMWPHINYWQRLTGTDRLYFAWTEGSAPCTVKVKEWELGHPPVAYLHVETGQEEPSFYCVERDSFIQFGPEAYQQVDIDTDQLIYRLPGLMPWMRYQLVVTGYWEGEGELRERLDIDGLTEQLIKLEPGIAETLTIWIPPAAYRDDKKVDVTLTLVSGEWALTGPMVLYEFEREEGGDGGPQLASARHVEPNNILLYQNFPNPVSRQTIITYQLPANGRLSLRIYDTTGRLVRTLVDKPTEMGYHRVRWDGKDNSDRMVANGVYFYRLEAAGLASTKKLVVLR